MKKFVIILVIVLLGIAGWAGSTYLVGGQVEKHYREHLARFEKWGPVQMTSESYQRGFLSSKGRTLIEFSVPGSAGDEGEIETKTLQLTLEHRICNGPLPVGGGSFSLAPKLAHIETRLVAATAGEEDLLSKLPWLGAITDVATISLSGRGRDRLLVPGLEKTLEEEQLTIHWGGLQSDTEFSMDLTELAGNLEIASLKMKDDEGSLQWDGAQVDFDLYEAFPMVYLGNYKSSFGPLEVDFDAAGKGRKKVRVEGVAIDSQASQNGSTVEYLQTLKVAKVEVDDAGYGPGELELAMRGLDGEVLSQYQRDALGVYEQESFDPESMGLYMMQVYMRLLSGMLKGSPEIELRKVHIATPEGDFSGKLRLKFHGNEDLEPGSMPALLQQLEGQAQVTADEKLVRTLLTSMISQQMKNAYRQQGLSLPTDEEIAARAGQQVEQQLEGLIGQQFIERSEGKFHGKAVLERGELKVNGNRLM